MVGSTTKSPFFRPSERSDRSQYDYTRTPSGKHVKVSRRKQRSSKSADAGGSSSSTDAGDKEKKSTVVGCAANLINAIVGSGIVGLPYAIQKAGFCAGTVLIVLCALLTEKSLRLLIETAKHAQVPTYERLAEAAFGRAGFRFIALNMFVMAYGAMLSYLMIVKDTFSAILGVSEDNLPMKRAVLFVISITIMVPLSSQRDMANLAKTSSMNVIFDIIMIFLVLYCSPLQEAWETFDWRKSTINNDTIFVGLGVLSFAFVCQHSSFIIAGSLERPTQSRWGTVTRSALIVCGLLASICGLGGFVAFQEDTQGNILNSLDNSLPADIARVLLGTTMLFVYPMECFVARHCCVVLFFEGRSAHDGDDSMVLNRRDRRILLTLFLYVISFVPAAMFQDVGIVLALVGALGGSCLSYVAPGMVYLAVHGGRFLQLSRSYFGPVAGGEQQSQSEERMPLYRQPSGDDDSMASSVGSGPPDSWLVQAFKRILWYLLLMPIWCFIARIGKSCLTDHIHDLAMKSPHPIRIGNVRYATALLNSGTTRVVLMPTRSPGRASPQLTANTKDLEQQHHQSTLPTQSTLLRADSIPKGYGTARTIDGRILALPPAHNPTSQPQQQQKQPQHHIKILQQPLAQGNGKGGANGKQPFRSINDTIGAQLVKQKAAGTDDDDDESDLENDPQEIPPNAADFVLAIFYIVFGMLALTAGIISIFMSE